MGDSEPTITLSSGYRALVAVHDMVSTLRAKGHTITVSADGHVRVIPPCSLDVHACLSASWHDVRALISERAERG